MNGASSRFAAPSLRYVPSGDPPFAAAKSASMPEAGFRLPSGPEPHKPLPPPAWRRSVLTRAPRWPTGVPRPFSARRGRQSSPSGVSATARTLEENRGPLAHPRKRDDTGTVTGAAKNHGDGVAPVVPAPDTGKRSPRAFCGERETPRCRRSASRFRFFSSAAARSTGSRRRRKRSGRVTLSTVRSSLVTRSPYVTPAARAGQGMENRYDLSGIVADDDNGETSA